jgi:hypothetical protein
MKKIFTLLLISSFLHTTPQVFNGGGGTILNNGGQESSFPLGVSGLPASADSLFGLEDVTINISHPAVEELEVYLLSPSGILVELAGALAIKGANFTSTCFHSKASLSVTRGTAPYTGTFVPLGNLGRFNTFKNPNGTWYLIVKDFAMNNNSGSVLSWNLRFSQAPAKPVILRSSNLPIVFINTGGQAISDNDIIVDMGIIDNGGARNNISDPRNNYNGKAACHIRGSSSKMFEKKNLKIELRDAGGVNPVDAPLLGMPAESDWVLTAGYADKTLMRNALAQQIFRQIGYYAPRTRFVELVLNGEYFGVYTFMENPKRSRDRINITKMTTLDNSNPGLTGGYIVQINRTDDPGWYSLNPGISSNNAKFYYQYIYPKAEEITSPQKDYIHRYMDSFEVAMASPAFADPVKGYKKYIDDVSFADFLIVSEFAKNVDSYRLSTYLFKDNIVEGGKLHVGPVWDFDLAFHNSFEGNSALEQFWQYENPNDFNPPPKWWLTLMTDPAFRNKVNCRYRTFRLGLLSNNNLYSYIDQTAQMLTEARTRNFQQFPIIGAYIYPNPQQQAGATYQSELDDLKSWIAKRGAWMDSNVPGSCPNVSVEELANAGNSIAAYPNPFEEKLVLRFSLAHFDSKVSIELYDLVGRKVYSKLAVATEGMHEETINTASLGSGTYLVKITAGDKIFHAKVVRTAE